MDVSNARRAPRRSRPSRARGLRTSTGWRRRVKCDEAKPKCFQCSKSDRDCLYGQSTDPAYTWRSGSDATGSRLDSREHVVQDAGCEGNNANGSNVSQESPDGLDNQPSIEETSGFLATFSAPVEASVIFPLEGSVDTPQDDQPGTGNNGSLPSADFDFSASPMAGSQTSLLNISPFEWYDLLAQDAISNIQRLNDASNGEPRWNFDETTLSRRQSPAPESSESHTHQTTGHPGERRSALDYRNDSLGVSLLDNHSAYKPWNTAERIELSAIELGFFRYYTEIIGSILDLFDPARHFTNIIPHLAVRNSGLLKSILAVAAKHISIGLIDPEGDPSASSGSTSSSPEVANGLPSELDQAPAHMATQYYYETLQYLSQTLLYPSYADSHEILATAIMISTYEMFDADGTSTSGNWERHLRGAFWIQRSQDNDGESFDGLRRAVWWAWLRQDIWAAFRAGRPTLTIWRPRKRLEDLNSDELATRIVYICAKCVEFAALDKSSPSQDIRQRIEHGNRLLLDLDNWHRVLPASYKPVMVATDPDVVRALSQTPPIAPEPSSRDESSKSQEQAPKTSFPSIWIHPPNHAGAIQMYHFAKAIVLLNQPTTGGLNAYRHRQKRLNESLHIVCGIANACQEREVAMAFVNVQAIFAVGQSVQTPEEQADLLQTLEEMLRISKLPAAGHVAELKKVWQE